jgi:hypothetical protein
MPLEFQLETGAIVGLEILLLYYLTTRPDVCDSVHDSTELQRCKQALGKNRSIAILLVTILVCTSLVGLILGYHRALVRIPALIGAYVMLVVAWSKPYF